MGRFYNRGTTQIAVWKNDRLISVTLKNGGDYCYFTAPARKLHSIFYAAGSHLTRLSDGFTICWLFVTAFDIFS